MEESIREALKELAGQYGAGLLEDTDRLAQFLEDRGVESREEIFRLTFALRWLMKAGWKPVPGASERSDAFYVNGLIKDLGFTASAAEDLVAALRSAAAGQREEKREGRDDGRIVASAGNLRRVAGGVAGKPRTMWLRRKSMRNGFVLIAALAAMAVLFFQIGGQRNPVGDELRVAFLTRMSGSASQSGLNQLRAAQLAVENINKQGGVRGYKLKIVGFDLPFDPIEAKKTCAAVMKDRSILLVVSGVGGPAGRSVLTAADESGVPLIVTAPDVSMADSSGRPFLYVFGIASDTAARASMTAYFMTRELAKKKAAVFYERNESFSESGHEALLRRIKDMGGEVLADVGFSARSDPDYMKSAAAINKNGAEVLVLPGRIDNAASIIREARAAGFTAAIIGENYTENISAAAGPAMAGSWWINEVSSLDPRIRSVLRDFRSLYNENVAPGDVEGSLLAYDAIIWAAHAFYTAAGYRGEAIRHSLLSTRNFPVTHATLTIDPRTHSPYKKAMAIVYCEGERGIFQKRARVNEHE